MANRLKDNINSKYFEAANALTSKKARRRIIAYVESYDDIYFWRTVLSEFEDDKRYFEVMLPSKANLTRGKKSVLMNFLKGEPLGKDMIACVDADYDYLLQKATNTSKQVLESPYVFHTYVYAIENFQCYAPSLHNVCVSVTLHDHRIFDFREYFRMFSERVGRLQDTVTAATTRINVATACTAFGRSERAALGAFEGENSAFGASAFSGLASSFFST